jgi:hypothetical protein
LSKVFSLFLFHDDSDAQKGLALKALQKIPQALSSGLTLVSELHDQSDLA